MSNLDELYQELHRIVHGIAVLDNQHKQYVKSVDSTVRAILKAELKARAIAHSIKEEIDNDTERSKNFSKEEAWGNDKCILD